MSSLNGFNGPQAGRPAARPVTEQPQGGVQPNWPQQNQAAQRGQQPAQAGYPQQSYGQGYPQQPAAPAPAYGGLAANPDPYAPNFEPYAAAAPASPQRAGQQAYQQTQAAQGYQPQVHPAQAHLAPAYGQQAYAPDPRAQAPQQWAGQPAPQRAFDVGSYLPQSAAAQTNANYRADPRHLEPEPSLSDWQHAQHQGTHGYELGDAHGSLNDGGFAQPAGGELEQNYGEDDGQDYDVEETGRGRRPMMIAAALAGAILVGGGMAYGYKSFLGGGATGNPPMVKSASEPSKIKPADAGGKQFAHTDSKIMGRLGDGAAPGAAASAGGEVDANGTRKVSTLVVGRDGSIQAPVAAPIEVAAAEPPPAADPAGSTVSVPGMIMVDALGQKNKSVAAAVAGGAADGGQAAAQNAQKVVVNPPAAPQKPIAVAKVAAAEAARALPDATGSIEPQAAAPVAKKPAAKKLAAIAPAIANAAASAAATPVATGGASGYVAVLASVPRSTSSRMDALKRFADMQQKYGNVLGGKTPDVAEANLGAKGAYHRLVVGPPGSREQASSLCTQLKAQGYPDCWVTSY